MRSTDPAGSQRHWYRDLSIRTRILGLTGVLLLGLVASLVSGVVNGNRASDLQAQADAAEKVQVQVETARYDLLWAANWQNITAWRSRVDGGAVAASPTATTWRSTPMAHRASSGCSTSTRASSTPGAREPGGDRDQLARHERLQRPDLRPVGRGAPRRG
jgi:hypothetical protein